MALKKPFVSDIYEKAVERLQCLQYSSDANSEKELGRGKRKRRPAVMSDYDDESPARSDITASDDEEYVPPKPPTPPALPKRTSTASYLWLRYNYQSR